MAIWFEGTAEIDCTIADVAASLLDRGEHHASVVRLMPGMTSVELTEQGPGVVILTTNEGVLRRTGLVVRAEPDRVVVESDEEYTAGRAVTATAHFLDEFTANPTGVTHHLVISEVSASGVLGFFYRTLGSSKTGNAFLTATAAYLGSLRP